MKTTYIALLILMFASETGAQEARRNRVLHFISHHKAQIALGTLAVLSSSADAASTIHAKKLCPLCQDQGFFGHRPTEVEVWGAEMGIASFEIGIDSLGRKYAPTPGGAWFLTALVNGTLTIQAIWDTQENVIAAASGQKQSDLRIARDRLTGIKQ
jgi:hypothetical protein